MLRLISALLTGSLFGAGLVVSGMTDTRKVQGFLDVLGAWDPTLVFVLGCAVLPMMAVWAWVGGRKISTLGRPMPAPIPQVVDTKLILGSAFFGIGWAIIGLCPGPALASISYGGWQGAVFLASMIAGMQLHPYAARCMDRQT